MKTYYYTVMLLFCLATACAQQNKDTTASKNIAIPAERKISIFPSDFKGGYPAVLFNPSEGTITAIAKAQSESEMFSKVGGVRSAYIYIEPRDPEFNSLEEEGNTVSITLNGHGDKAYLDPEKQVDTIHSSKEIDRKDFSKDNVFRLQLGKAQYVLQILEFDKKEQTLVFRYRVISD